ncbi:MULTISPECIES: hypothetical protein [Halorubrum]|uniref:hypothetical protein n=1 Tax=Halorubrum TaxID=56688 RepID=UPI0012674E51|nr:MULTISPECIES: hypothetical protein [Halorubrum]
MERTQVCDRLTNMSPVELVSVISFMGSGIIMFTLPIAQLQIHFWVVLVVGFLGDTITTGYLGKFDLEEQNRGYTRWACGSEPTLTCAAGTRVILLGAILLPYLSVVRYGFLQEYYPVYLTALLTPIVIGLMAAGATLANTYGIWNANRRSPS